MDRIKIDVPSIRDSLQGNNTLFRLAQLVMNNPLNHFDFNFKNCAALDQNAVAMLGGLANFVDKHNTLKNRGVVGGLILPRAGVMFEVESMSQVIREQLVENNFLNNFSKAYFDGYGKGSYIGYREHLNYLDADEIVTHLSEEWLTSEKLSLSNELKSAIVSKIFEIYMNAYGHGVKMEGVEIPLVTSCGQYLKKDRLLRLSVLDFGQGIVTNVKNYLENEKMSDIDALKWAIKRGNSTQTDSVEKNMPRGLGLDLLMEFVRVNQGALTIASNKVTTHISHDESVVTETLKYPIYGTMVSITINCDDRHYQFVSEQTDENYF